MVDHPAAFESAGAHARSNAYQTGETQIEIFRLDTSMRRAIPIIWCHGFQLVANAQQHLQGAYWRFLEPVVSRSRLPLLAADLGGPSTWGNDTALARIDTLITWAGANLGTRTDRVVIAGESMGSLLALNWAWRNQPKVAALWIRAPITALAAFHDRNATFTGLIEAAYTNLAGYTAALPTHDPVQNRAKLHGLADRTRIDYTVDDEFILPSEVVSHATGTGVREVYAHAGDHAANLYFDPDPVAAWLADTLVDPIAA